MRIIIPCIYRKLSSPTMYESVSQTSGNENAQIGGEGCHTSDDAVFQHFHSSKDLYTCLLPQECSSSFTKVLINSIFFFLLLLSTVRKITLIRKLHKSKANTYIYVIPFEIEVVMLCTNYNLLHKRLKFRYAFCASRE